MASAFVLQRIKSVFSRLDISELEPAGAVQPGDVPRTILDDGRIVEFRIQHGNERTVGPAGVGYHHMPLQFTLIDRVAGGKDIGKIAKDIAFVEVFDPFPELQRIGRIVLQRILDPHGYRPQLGVYYRIRLWNRIYQQFCPDVFPLDVFVEIEDDLFSGETFDRVGRQGRYQPWRDRVPGPAGWRHDIGAPQVTDGAEKDQCKKDEKIQTMHFANIIRLGV